MTPEATADGQYTGCDVVEVRAGNIVNIRAHDFAGDRFIEGAGFVWTNGRFLYYAGSQGVGRSPNDGSVGTPTSIASGAQQASFGHAMFADPTMNQNFRFCSSCARDVTTGGVAPGGIFNQLQCLDDDLRYQSYHALPSTYTMNSLFFIAAGGGAVVFFDSSGHWQLVTLSCTSQSTVEQLQTPTGLSVGYPESPSFCATLGRAMSGILEAVEGEYRVVYTGRAEAGQSVLRRFGLQSDTVPHGDFDHYDPPVNDELHSGSLMAPASCADVKPICSVATDWTRVYAHFEKESYGPVSANWSYVGCYADSCDFAPGWSDGHWVRLGHVDGSGSIMARPWHSGAECVQSVRRTYPDANGARYDVRDNDCLAVFGMTNPANQESTIWQSCQFATDEVREVDVQGGAGAADACAVACAGFTPPYTHFSLQGSSSCFCQNEYSSQAEVDIGECDADSDVSDTGVADLCGNGQDDCATRNAIYEISGVVSGPLPASAPCPAMPFNEAVSHCTAPAEDVQTTCDDAPVASSGAQRLAGVTSCIGVDMNPYSGDDGGFVWTDGRYTYVGGNSGVGAQRGGVAALDGAWHENLFQVTSHTQQSNYGWAIFADATQGQIYRLCSSCTSTPTSGNVDPGGSFNQLQCLDDRLGYQSYQSLPQTYTMSSQLFMATGGGETVFYDSQGHWQLITLGCNSDSPPLVRSLGSGSHVQHFGGCASQGNAMSGILEYHAGRYSVVYPQPTGQLWRKTLPDGDDVRIGNVDHGSYGWDDHVCSIATDYENIYLHYEHGGGLDEALVTCGATFRP